jgi:CheY-like chemotaxis protein
MGKKILLADDSITIQKVIELTFSDEDFDVVTVGNGRLAIERIQEVQPDIVLCDIIMPEKDGYEVCEYVKQNPAFAHVPVLLLTGAFEPFDQERAARVGSDGYLAKPFEPQTLISKVKELLSRGPRPAVAAGAPAQAPGARVPGSVAPPAAPRPAPVSGTVPLTPSVVSAVPPAAAHEPEVTFIPEEPFDQAASDAYAPAIEFTAESLPPEVEAAPSGGYYGGEANLTAGPELVAEQDAAGEFQAAPSVYGVDEVLEVDRGGEAAASAGEPWTPGTPQAPWEEGAGSRGAGPVFEEVFEEHAETGPAPAPASEPESIPPMLLEYDAGPQGQYAAFEAQLRPETPAPSRPAAPAPARPEARPGPSAADLFAEEMTEFEPEVVVSQPAAAAPRAPQKPSAPPRPAAPSISFADVAPKPAEVAKPTPSLAAEVPVPMDMVAQIAQRVVGQVSEKVIREVAWEILPDLAEALIKKEIERITAELKEP